MKDFVRGLCALVLLVAVGIIAGPVPVRAATGNEGFNVTTSPLPIKISATPGSHVETKLRIKNLANQADGIKVGLMKFKGSKVDGKPDLQDLTKEDTFASWVHFSPSQFLAEPGVWYTVNMSIDVPSTASLGYYMAVTFSPASVPGGRKVTSLKGSAATLVLLDVKGANERRKLAIEDFAASHKVYEYLPATFTVKVRNEGNIYIPPQGSIFLSKGNKQVDALDFNAIGGSVLPDSTRTFNEPWSNGFPVFKNHIENGKLVPKKNGTYQQDLKWDFGKANKWRFGKYTARLLIAYDDGKRDVPLESTLTFWVIPWKLILVTVLILGLIGFGIFGLIRGTIRGARGSTGRYHRRR